MNATKPILIAVLGILLISAVATITPATRAATSAYVASFQGSESHYVSTSSLLGTVVHYQVANGVYSGQAGNSSLSTKVTNYVGTSTGTNSSINLSVSSNYSNNMVKAIVSGNGGTLLYVAATQDGIDQVVWSGVVEINATTSTTITGLAYINASETALITLGFAGESAIETATSQLGTTSSVSISVPQFAFSESSQLTVSGNVAVIFPLRYASLNLGTTSVNATSSITAPLVSVGTSTFLQTTYPDMIWQGSASATTSFNGTSSTGQITARAAEFFGANGTIVGYTQEFNLATNKSAIVAGVTIDAQNVASSTLVVSTSQPTGGNASNAAFVIAVNGQPVVIQPSGNSTISSTANVQTQHSVLVNGSTRTLVLLNTNDSSNVYLLLNLSNNSSQSVQQVSPQSENETTISVGASTYQATQLNITASGNIVFNITTSYPSVIVFKATATGLVQLNATNYWVSNGTVYVFDDHSSTYYVANAGTTSTGPTTTGSTASGSSTTTVATTASGQTSSASVTGSGGSMDLEIAAAVVVVLVAIGIIVVALRRKKQ